MEDGPAGLLEWTLNAELGERSNRCARLSWSFWGELVCVDET
jgi:hypothetical protein